MKITVSGTDDDSDNWNINVSGLPRNHQGTAINWGLEEYDLEHYFESPVTEQAECEVSKCFRIENTYREETLSYTKIWNDNDNVSGTRPDVTTFLRSLTLYAGESLSDRKSGDAGNRWRYFDLW